MTAPNPHRVKTTRAARRKQYAGVKHKPYSKTGAFSDSGPSRQMAQAMQAWLLKREIAFTQGYGCFKKKARRDS